MAHSKVPRFEFIGKKFGPTTILADRLYTTYFELINLNFRIRKHTFWYAKSQIGSSAFVDRENLILGAPGAFAWSGLVLAADLSREDSLVFSELCQEEVGKAGKNHWCRELNQPKDSYSGSSVLILRNVRGYPGEALYVTGLPGENYYGAVRFYRNDGRNLREIEELLIDGREHFLDFFQQL